MPDYKTRRARGIPLTQCPAVENANQQGATLIVVLVLVIAMSAIAMSSSIDTGLQFKMVRNDQFSTSTYLAAYSEINAQMGDINTNEESEPDDKVLDLLTYAVGEPNTLLQTDYFGPHKGSGAFDQEVAFTLSCNPNDCPSPPGYTMSEVTKVLRAVIDSRADMAVSGAKSDQRQSFWYLLPQTDLVTFD